MDPLRNPYSPGAGAPPPELAGRDDLMRRAAVALDRIRLGKSARSFIFYGLRGVGKTVLLNKIRLDAEARGFVAVSIEAPEGRALPDVLVPPLRAALLKLSRVAKVKDYARRSLRALANFAKALKVNYNDVEISIDIPSEPGLADSGDLTADLTDLLVTVGQAARDNDSALVLAVDELQYVPEKQLASLISAFHSISQRQLPVAMLAAGLPQLVGQLGEAKSYAERLFEFSRIDKLDETAATVALCKPAEREGVAFAPEAVREILAQTSGYPYFLQEWGKHSWNLASSSPITALDAEQATQDALAELDAGFFRVRFDLLTPAEKKYMRAMAELGPGPHRSGDIAEKLGQKVSAAAPVRSGLIRKGLIYSPAHGETAFTVPLFDGFMKRAVGFR